MSDSSKIIAAIAQVLSDDPALNALCDGMIISGFRRAQADAYLGGSHQACIGVRALSRVSNGLPGCYYHGTSTQDLLVEFAIITIADDDSSTAAIASRIEDLMKAGVTQVMDGIEYQLVTGQISFSPLNDDQAPANWVQLVGTARIKYFG